MHNNSSLWTPLYLLTLLCTVFCSSSKYEVGVGTEEIALEMIASALTMLMCQAIPVTWIGIQIKKPQARNTTWYVMIFSVNSVKHFFFRNLNPPETFSAGSSLAMGVKKVIEAKK